MNNPDSKKQKETYRQKITAEWDRIDQQQLGSG